jgi:hypothetical protein
VPASPWYFNSVRPTRYRGVIKLAMAVMMLCGGCVTVKPEAKELLADPAMLFDSAAMARRHEEHALENREGSMGGGSARGSGCGCN